MVVVHSEKSLCGLIASIPVHWFYVEKCKVRFSFQRPPYPGTIYWQSKLSATYWHSYVFQHSNLVLQEDLVFRDMIFNILETENEYPSGKESAFSLFLDEVWSGGSSMWLTFPGIWAGQRAESRTSVLPELWWPKHALWSGCYLVLPQRETEGLGKHVLPYNWNSIITASRSFMGRVLGLEPGHPRVTICVTFINSYNPFELQLPHLWSGDTTTIEYGGSLMR